jgi:hypothetical protein
MIADFEIIEMLHKMKKKEMKALEATKASDTGNSIYYGARIGMLNEILDGIDSLK